jgi:hypothetical protein
MNIHFPHDLTNLEFARHISNKWAPTEMFDESHEDNDKFALSTLSYWIKHSTKFRHIASGTWRGGATGVRWNLAILVCVVSSLISVDERLNVPPKVQAVYSEGFQKRSWAQVKQLGLWLAREIQRSIDILSKTFPARSEAWKKAVLAEHARYHPGTAGTIFRASPGVSVTYGVPVEPAELHACAQKLLQDGEVTLAPDDEHEASSHMVEPRITRSRRGSQLESSSDEPREKFNLTDVGSSSDDSDHLSLVRGQNLRGELGEHMVV